MALQFSTTLRNAQLDQIETVTGTSPIMTIRSGAPPADCGTANSGTVLATLTRHVLSRSSHLGEHLGDHHTATDIRAEHDCLAITNLVMDVEAHLLDSWRQSLSEVASVVVASSGSDLLEIHGNRDSTDYDWNQEAIGDSLTQS